MESDNYTVLLYRDEQGKEPFSDWLATLDRRSRARILARLDRIELGNWGDWKLLSPGLGEFRFHFSGGLRVYFGIEGQSIVLLLSGGNKSSQKKDIKKARFLWEKYLTHTKN
jgi:putative addiction module killer protein